MPPEARVLIIEDNHRWRETYARILPRGGHSIAATITHISGAEQTIDSIKRSGDWIDVAIVDRNLGRSHNGEDGARVVGMLRRDLPDAKILGITSHPAGVRGADANLDKRGMHPAELIEVVTGL